MSENVTREGIEVRAGQVWRDLDKRMHGRTIRLTWVAGGFAHYEEPRKGRIAVKRMYRHSTGFELVSRPEL